MLYNTWSRLTGLMPGEIHHSELTWLFSPHSHFPVLSRRRVGMIINRVRLFAFLFAVLTPLWSLIDYIVFPFPLWITLACMRLAAGFAFYLLVIYCRPSGRLSTAYLRLATLFAIPTVFYIASHQVLASYHLDGMSAAIGAGYAFLPFVLVAGLAIFPLTFVETALIASPILFAQGFSAVLNLSTAEWIPLAGTFWLLLLIAAVSSLASLSQLTFMIALVQQTIRDPLTGAYSRSCGQETLELRFSLAERSASPLAVAFIDLDHFKSVNDTYGHEAGDRSLIGAVAWIESTLRRGDVLCRWGGEEFVLILPNISLDQAHHALSRIQANGFGMRPDGKTPLTASIGIAERSADLAADWKSLVDIADQRMYAAKISGRNRLIAQNCPSELAGAAV